MVDKAMRDKMMGDKAPRFPASRNPAQHQMRRWKPRRQPSASRASNPTAFCCWELSNLWKQGPVQRLSFPSFCLPLSLFVVCLHILPHPNLSCLLLFLHPVSHHPFMLSPCILFVFLDVSHPVVSHHYISLYLYLVYHHRFILSPSMVLGIALFPVLFILSPVFCFPFLILFPILFIWSLIIVSSCPPSSCRCQCLFDRVRGVVKVFF